MAKRHAKRHHRAHKEERQARTTAQPVQTAPASLAENLSGLEAIPDHSTARPLRQAAVLQLQQSQGNSYVQRLLAHQKHSVQRAGDDEEKTLGPQNMQGPEDMKAGDQEGDEIQMERDETETPWGSTYMYVEVKPIPHKLIGNLKPSATGAHYQIGYHYKWRQAYRDKVKAGIRGGKSDVAGPWGRADLAGSDAFKWSAGLKDTSPGAYTAYMDHPGGIGLPSMRAEEQFTVVNPVKIDLASRRARDIYDFDNPIPIQIEGPAELEYKLDASQVHSKRIGVAASGSNSSSISDKVTFGINAGLEGGGGGPPGGPSKPEGKVGGQYGVSSETTHNWQEQWRSETYSRDETRSGTWEKETFKPDAKGKGISKMIIPQYEWVEWNADVYSHNPSNLTVTGGPEKVVVGMLRPTGSFKVQKSTDPGQYSDSNPTEAAQTDVDSSDKPLTEQHDTQVAARGNWRVVPGAKWGSDTLQFIQGPVSMEPAGRDYGMQDGDKIHPGHGVWSKGGSFGTTLENGMVTSSNKDSSHVTKHTESLSLSAGLSKKGLGSIGTSLGFENSTSLSNATGTGLSATSGVTEQTQLTVSHTVAKKRTQNQFVLFTPLVNHKVFKVAYGATGPAPGAKGVDPEQACTIIYIHTYQHQPIPHVKVKDVRKDETPPRGRYDWPKYTEV